ncbi:MAG: hypothetical protein GX275_04715 [Clostridiales bacterium]|nr:hypothetical protein [Clostridiales bacterium]
MEEDKVKNKNVEIDEIINQWLLDENTNINSNVDKFLNNFTNIEIKGYENEISPIVESVHNKYNNYKFVPFSGEEGEEKIFYNFLSLVLESNIKTTIYILYEEDISWIGNKSRFIKNIIALLTEIVKKGNKIKIIQSNNRSSEEMILILEMILPVYLLGNLETYYFPKFKDGLFKHTMIVAKDIASITSTSMNSLPEKRVGVFTTDKQVYTDSYNQFQEYLKMCSPLLRVITQKEKNIHFKTIINFEAKKGNSVIRTEILSPLTIPKDTLVSMIKRENYEDEESIIEEFEIKSNNFKNILKDYSFLEIVSLPSIENIKNGKVKINLFHGLGCKDAYYNIQEFTKHIESVINYLKNYDNYSVTIVEKAEDIKGVIYVKEGVGVLISRSTAPYMVLAVTEVKMTNAFWQYMCYKGLTYNNKEDNKIKTIELLENYLDELKQS